GWSASGEILRSAYTLHAEDNDFVQAGNFYRHALSATDRNHLVSNIVGHMGQGVDRFVQERAIKNWYQVDKELGSRIAEGLGLAPALSTTGQDGQNT
ncbi:MAG: catalase, partial [Ktedonobacteraceae bacterium]|nr:catalase [Ktedonobacteraceae bacterium]